MRDLFRQSKKLGVCLPLQSSSLVVNKLICCPCDHLSPTDFLFWSLEIAGLYPREPDLSHLHTALPSKILARMTCIYTLRRMTISSEWFWLWSFRELFSSNRPKLCHWWSKTMAEHPRLVLGVKVNVVFHVVKCAGCFDWTNDWT